MRSHQKKNLLATFCDGSPGPSPQLPQNLPQPFQKHAQVTIHGQLRVGHFEHGANGLLQLRKGHPNRVSFSPESLALVKGSLAKSYTKDKFTQSRNGKTTTAKGSILPSNSAWSFDSNSLAARHSSFSCSNSAADSAKDSSRAETK